MSNIIQDAKSVLDRLKIPNETIKFSGKAKDTYAVLTPLDSSFEYANDKPIEDVQGLRISIFSKTNFISFVNDLCIKLLDADLAITNRRYVGFENDTLYYHYVIDIEKNYIMEDK